MKEGHRLNYIICLDFFFFFLDSHIRVLHYDNVICVYDISAFGMHIAFWCTCYIHFL